MKKKLLAGIMTLALCSTSMPQMIFAEEFTSGILEEMTPEETDETPEVFTDENQAAGDDVGGVSEFSSEEVPEFDDESDNAAVGTDGGDTTAIKEIDINNISDSGSGFTYANSVCTINIPGSYRFTGNGETSNRIVIDNITSGTVKIYLNNVNISTDAGPALHIKSTVTTQVCIYLQGSNALKTTGSAFAALQKDYGAENDGKLIIDNADSTNIGSLIADASCNNNWGAGIGGGICQYQDNIDNNGNSSHIYIYGGSVTARSYYGAGIGGSFGYYTTNNSGNGNHIYIYGGSVTAYSYYGAGIGGGGYVHHMTNSGNGSHIYIYGGSVTAYSHHGAGIGGGVSDDSNGGGSNGGGSYISISNSSSFVNANKISKSDTNNISLYPLEIPNTNNLKITIDEIEWTPYNCSACNSSDSNLYPWLTGEDHIVTIGSETKAYIFDSSSKTFSNNKRNLSCYNFAFEPPTNRTYNNSSKTATITAKDGIKGVENITVKYFLGDTQVSNPINAGTYTVKIDVSESVFNHFANNLTDPTWTFTISKANKPSDYPSNTTISVPWSCKNVSDINTDVLPENWEWDNTDSSKELQIGTNSITAVYNGADKGNYNTESVIYTVTRNKCEHTHTVDRYYSSASCTSSGYSGDTYCTDCGALVSSGYTISAYGHSYDDGVITTEPTAETDGVVTYTCKRCKHQDTRTLGKLNDGEPYIEGDFLKKGWDSVKEIIKKSKEKDLVSIILNGAQTLPASVLSELKGKDINLSLNMENGFIWKVNGSSITAEAPAGVDLSVAKATDYIPASLYNLVSTNQNDFAFHLGTSGAFDFPMGLSVKADASCAGLMANLFWYDAPNQILQCIQSVTVSGALERSIPYADFTLSKGQDYFVVFATESFNGRSIHMDGSITDENGSYLRPANTAISSCSVDRNKLTVKLAKGCAGAQGYDFVVGKKSNMTQTGKFNKTISSQSKPQASFKYLAKGTWYVAARSWVLDEQGNKVYGSWSTVKKFKITVVTSQQPKIKEVNVKGNTVTITYSKCKNAGGYEVVLGTEYKTSTDEKYPVRKYVKRTQDTTTVTFTNLKKGTWYLGVRSWTQSSKDKYKTYSPYSAMKKFKIKK